jgi:hypothetical protein
MRQTILNLVFRCQSCRKPFTIVHPSTITLNSYTCLTCGTVNTLVEEKSKSELPLPDKPKKNKDLKDR